MRVRGVVADCCLFALPSIATASRVAKVHELKASPARFTAAFFRRVAQAGPHH